MNGIRSQLCILFGLLCLLLTVSACGGGGDGGDPASLNPLWVTIDSTSLDLVVTMSQISLFGATYCDNCPPSESAFGYCPEIRPPRTSAVTLSWENLTTGETGTAVNVISGSCSCLFSNCVTVYRNRWAAYDIPLEIGENTIHVGAQYGGYTVNKTVTITRTPGALMGLVALAGKGEVTLQWEGVSNATSYNLYWSTSANFSKETASKIFGVASPFRHEGLTDNLTYYYAVSAVLGEYEGPLSPIVLATPGWQTEILGAIAATTNQMEASIALDSFSHIHTLYAYNECTNYATIGSTTYCSAYKNYNNYMTNAAGSWELQALANSLYVDANIAVDSDDRVHISYANFYGVIHAVQVAGSWSDEVVDEQGWCDTSLAVDSENNPHLVYYGSALSSLEFKYATKLSGSWEQEVVDLSLQDMGCGPQEKSLSLAMGIDGAPHIAYAGRAPDYGLKYAVKVDGEWNVDTVDSGYITHLAVAVDSAGTVHIAYVNNAGQLKYAHYNNENGWLIETIDISYATAPALAFDGDGKVHISYLVSYQLKYATKAGSTWSESILDSNAHSDTALAVDRFGTVHIVYFCEGNLKYVTNK